MTFLEAAVVVLEREGRPMHYRDIARRAIELDLLSHIGKTPDQAMQTRLSSALRRDPKGSRIVRKGPGVYQLRPGVRSGDGKPPVKDDASKTPSSAGDKPQRTSEPKDAEAKKEAGRPEKRDAPQQAQKTEHTEPPPKQEGPVDKEEHRQQQGRSRKDEPRQGNRSDRREQPRQSEPSPNRDRRESQPAPKASPRQEPRSSGPGQGSDPRPDRSPQPRQEARPEPTSRDDRRRRPRDDEGADEENRPPRRQRSTNGGGHQQQPQDRAPGEGSSRNRRRRKRRRKSLPPEAGADLLEAITRFIEVRPAEVAISELVRMTKSRGLLEGEPASVEAALIAALRADNAVAVANGGKPRFIITSSSVGMTDRVIDQESSSIEQKINAEVEHLRETTTRDIGSRLAQEPLVSLVALTKSCLSHAGFGEAKQVKSGAEEALLKVPPPHLGAGTLAVVVTSWRDGDNERLKRRVAELRGSLHELGASRGLLVWSRPAPDGALAAAMAPGAAAVEIWDARELARRMVSAGIGVRPVVVKLPLLDPAFFTKAES